jgi:DnaJ-class molecular chaperone
MPNPYDTLGVSKSASEAEIKKAFRSLAKKFHPDKHGGDEKAAKKFKEISAAYDIVGDKEKRAKYDRGEIDEGGNPRGFDPRGQGGPFRGGGGDPFGGAGGGPRDFHYTFSEGDAEGMRAEDILSDLFSGGGPFGGGGRRGGGARAPRRGEDYSLNTVVSFEEAALGGTRRVALPDGREIDVKIPPGVKDGQQIRIKGQGGVGASGGPAGDMMIGISVAPHPYYVRDGRDLRMDLPVSLKEAVLGGKVPVPTLTGTVSLTVPPNSNTGSTLRLKGKGIPAHGGEAAGDLYVRLVVNLPDQPDSDLRKFAEGWKAAYDPRARLMK